jgi:hypothetical protein
MRGYLYILSNKAIPGLLKIGYTTRDIEKRVLELTTTGVPSKFEIEFYCEIGNARIFESAVHRELKKYRQEREFFQCSIKQAVEIVKHVASNGLHVYYGSGGRSASIYITPDEQEEIIIQAEYNRLLRQRRQEEIKAHHKKLKDLGDRFLETYNKAAIGHIRCLEESTKHDGLKAIGFGLALFSVIGIPLADKILPPSGEMNKRIAKVMSDSEKDDLVQCLKVFKEILDLGYDDCKIISQRYCNGIIKYNEYKRFEIGLEFEQVLIEKSKEEYDRIFA